MKKNPTKQTKVEIEQNKKSPPESTYYEKPQEGLALLIGQSLPELEKQYGIPQRIDKTIYGYQWYIYNKKYKKYLQVGVVNNLVVTVYAAGEDLDVAPFEIGQPLEEILNTQYINTNIDLTLNGNDYRFKLNDTDIHTRPLIQLGGVYAQLYLDKNTGTLASIRFLDANTLIKLRPYELFCNGKLMKAVKPDSVLWAQAQQGTKKQIFDITNVMRSRNNLKPLLWDRKIAKVAFNHSKEMYGLIHMPHKSKKYKNLTNRLKMAKIHFQTAGENFAVKYSDGPSAVEGWLNSEVYRTALLNKNFTHLGVGVYQDYYTQDFIKQKN